VVEVKNGFNPEAVLEELYRQTPLEESFGINAVCLVDGQPSTLGLKELLSVYLGHRYEVVRRRSQFRRAKAADRLHLVEGLLVALLDIDEVIELIRSSDDAEIARTRLMDVFDLTDTQARYILDMQLRRLTRFSRIELETEQDELRRRIDELDAILSDEALLRSVVSRELSEMAEQFGTPRRTVLLEASGQSSVTQSQALEVTDDPCRVLLSSTALLARTRDEASFGAPGKRAKHDVVVSTAATTARGQVGVVTSTGRLHRLDVLDLPVLPDTAAAPHLQGGAPLSEFLALDRDERPLCLLELGADVPGLALGTAAGVVKRVTPDHPANRDVWEVIRLDDGDTVVGAVALPSGAEQLCFITSDAQLLHYPAAQVRAQGRAGGGVAGVKLSAGATVVFFGAVPRIQDAVVVTVSGSSTALPGTQPGSAKVTPMEQYPSKGRATGGVRAHRFLKGEDVLLLGWAGIGPAIAAAGSGIPVELPDPIDRRDGSGVPVRQPIAAVASPLDSAS
jgi:DNA gyrase subunit A